METYEVHPRAGLGPFRLGMTREEAEKLRARLGLPEPPDSFYLEYEEGRLSRIGLNAAENVRILYRGLDLIHTHAEDVIAALSKESGFVCDCADHDLADTYDFPALGLELWREEPYHPKLLEEPGFQRMLARDPFTDYQLGWYFLQVWVQADQFRADFPLRECPAPDYDSWFLQQEEPEPIPPERLAAVARQRRGTMTDIKSMNLAEMSAYFKELGEPAFRAKQVFQWLHRGVSSFDEMTNLSKALREKLAAACVLCPPRVERKQVSAQDGTIKYLWRLGDGNCIETVLMRYHHGNTVCISSQVGCRMGCAFCASTLGGKIRDLTPAEMVDQVLFTQLDSGVPVSNIVLMGIGEPLDNFDTVLRFLELVNSPEGLNIGMRHISLSTCGLTEKIDKLADYQLQLTLSVSLHAPDDETRSRIMPVNRGVGVEQLFAACRRYFEKTGRRISYEYAMIDGVNDADWQADLLARHLKGTPGHVNLIPLNHVEESPLKPSRRVAAFQKRLESHGVTATVRRKLGGDIDASCGQLRRKQIQGQL